MKVVLTDQQKAELNRLWFIYGNGHKKHTLGNHRFIQCLLESNEDNRKFFVNTASVMNRLSAECIIEVDKIIDHFKLGDRVKIKTNAIHQESQKSLNKLRGKIIAIEQNSYIIKIDGFWARLPFAGNELIAI